MSTDLSPLAIAFIGITLLAIHLFARAHQHPRKLTTLLLGYAAVQYLVGLTGFYQYTEVLPPPFLLNILPAVLAISWLFFSGAGRALLAGFDRRRITLLHVVRVPVELVLYGLFLAEQLPRIMTFEGNNFDIMIGLTAPAIWYFGYGKGWVTPGLIRIWHYVGLLLLLNIVVTAILAAPTPFQQIAFAQPNVAVLRAPFNLLPAVVVPLVVVGHLVGLGTDKK